MHALRLTSAEQRHVMEEVHNYVEQGMEVPAILRSSRLTLPLSIAEENDVEITLGRMALEQKEALFQAIQERFDKKFLPNLFGPEERETLTPDLSKPTLNKRRLSTRIWDLHFGEELNEDIHSLLGAQRRVRDKSTDFPIYSKVVEILRIDQNGRLQISDIFEITTSPENRKAIKNAVKKTLKQLGLPIGVALNNVEIARFSRIKAQALKVTPRFDVSGRDTFFP